MKKALQLVLPLAVLAIAALGALAMYMARSEAETVVPEAPLPLVRVLTISKQDRLFKVTSQGTVNPRTESSLVPEVAGRVIEVASSFESGGFFEENDILLRIDPHDYRQAAVQAQAQVAQAELRLALEEAEAEVAAREWEDIGDGDEASALTLRQPQLAEARAALEAARAALERDRRNLERTEIRAPYAGRVRAKHVDVGQYVSPGTPLASIYAVDFAEIRLPLPDHELAFLDLPLDYRGDTESRPGPEVILKAEFAGRVFRWRGKIVRTEGEIDRRSRMVQVVARVKDPYGRGDDPDRPPLAAGLFVGAEIVGHTAVDVAVVPRSALRDGDRVLVIDGENRLHSRQVEVIRRTRDDVVVGTGLTDGERVCLTPLAAVTEGMRVRIETAS